MGKMEKGFMFLKWEWGRDGSGNKVAEMGGIWHFWLVE